MNTKLVQRFDSDLRLLYGAGGTPVKTLWKLGLSAKDREEALRLLFLCAAHFRSISAVPGGRTVLAVG